MCIRDRHSSFVHLASVTDSRHLHQQFSVVDGVHHAVVTDTNTPLAIAAPEFLGAGGGLEERFSR